jgi:hypothetical protein
MAARAGSCVVAARGIHAPRPGCESADPLTQEKCRNRLFAAQQAFHGRGDTPDKLVAGIAAQAAQYALLGYPKAMVRQIGAAAEEHHRRACTWAELPR